MSTNTEDFYRSKPRRKALEALEEKAEKLGLDFSVEDFEGDFKMSPDSFQALLEMIRDAEADASYADTQRIEERAGRIARKMQSRAMQRLVREGSFKGFFEKVGDVKTDEERILGYVAAGWKNLALAVCPGWKEFRAQLKDLEEFLLRNKHVLHLEPELAKIDELEELLHEGEWTVEDRLKRAERRQKITHQRDIAYFIPSWSSVL